MRNAKFSGWAFATLLCITLFGQCAFAHHSFALFDPGKTVTVSGTVRSFEWGNPHVWLWIDTINPDGTQTTWGFESAAPGELVRLAGWSRSTFQMGDKVTVLANPLRDGRPGGSLRSITRADGTVLAAGQPPPGAGPVAGAAPPAGGPPH
jgi:hypothetical protein